jgi:Prokaryotic E2 family E
MALIPQDDVEFLTEKGYDYELAQVGNEIHLVIHRFPFPSYVPKEADILIRILSGYPQTAVDMFYTIPDVRLASGAFPQNCDQHPAIGAKTWQQWSRHLTWRSGIDNLRTFLAAVVAEINKGI